MPTPPGFAQVSVQMTHTGLSRPAYITFGVDPTSTDPQSVAGAVAGTLGDASGLKSILDAECVFSQVLVSLGTDGGEDIVGGVTISVAGTFVASSLPANCALLVHKRTQRGGRRGRGRMFIPWALNEAQVDEAGILSSTGVNTAQAAVEFWRASLGISQVPMVLMHDPSQPGIDNPTTPGPPDIVTALSVDKLISTQRRRLGRR